MVDIVSVQKRSEMMAGITGKNTKPEIFVRQLLHRMGYRFRLHRKDLPGKPDIFLPKFCVAIFVQGCFWHGHEDCHLFRIPKTRVDFWRAKISSNQERDSRVRNELIQTEFRVLDVWECSLKGKTALDTEALSKKIEQFIVDPSHTYHEIRGCND